MSKVVFKELSGWGDNDGEILYTASNPRIQVSILNRSPQTGWAGDAATYSIRVRTGSWLEWTKDGCPLFVAKVFAAGGSTEPVFQKQYIGEKEKTSGDCWRDFAFQINRSSLNSRYNAIIIQLFVWNVDRAKWDVINLPAYKVDTPVSVIRQADGSISGGLFGSSAGTGSPIGDFANLLKWAVLGIGGLYVFGALGPITRALSLRAADRVSLSRAVANEERKRSTAAKAVLDAVKEGSQGV